jgi:hypothetical protein
MEVTSHPSADYVMRVHRATRLGIVASQQFIATQPTQLTERILQAAETQASGPFLHDPIEDAPETAAIVAAAFARAETEIDAERHPGMFRGRCHAVWHRVERILRDDSSIEWFSPTRMNPGRCFD